MDAQMRDRDLVLPPNTYAYVLDSTKGRVMVYVGPFKSSLSQTDRMVAWNGEEFVPELDMDETINTFVKAQEGQYVILHDPAKGEIAHPNQGSTSDAIELAAGRKVIIPGPVSFSLWPGQSAQVIDGHHLKSNEFLLVRVYEAAQARKHAESAVVATTDDKKGPELAKLKSFAMGQLMVIKGTDVSFYIPSTGIEVIPEQSTGTTPGAYNNYGQTFVREAATLERQEYVILLDEDGEKRYVKGPTVVFPEPTEQFITDNEGNRKFKAIELNEQSGLYVKVIADYEEGGKKHKAGDELFLTGKDQPIYYPRAEHSIIQYGDQQKHHAVAIPKGEGRYVLDRNTGEVQLVTGPKMFLPDPRHQVIVRRILDPKIVEVMYPGNDKALEVNDLLQARMSSLPESVNTANYLSSSAAAAEPLRGFDRSLRQRSAAVSSEFGGEVTARGTSYKKARTITLDTKYEGAVTINIWPGYAVLVSDKTGNRRVEMGPKAVLLEYDESLMVLSLSTGKPKNDAYPLSTVYLRTVNNAVSDQVTVETKDLVNIRLDLSYRVNFDQETAAKWFDIENYIGLLTEHCRSRLRNLAKRHNVKEFYDRYIDLVRDSLLGTAAKGGKREGMTFEENGMRLYDVEVTHAVIDDVSVGGLLEDATKTTMTGELRLAQAEETTRREARMEELKRETIIYTEGTRIAQSDAVLGQIERDLRCRLAEADVNYTLEEESSKLSELKRSDTKADYLQSLELQSSLDGVELSRAEVEGELFVQRMTALQGGVIEALQTFGDRALIDKALVAIAPVALGLNITTGDLLGRVFEGTPAEKVFDTITARPFAGSTLDIKSNN